MALLTAFLTYLGKFIAMLAVVVVAFLCGKKFRQSRDSKNNQSAN